MTNTGNRNTGDCNTGDSNTGYWNTGNRNTGYWNTGNRNTGYWNTGNRNTGDRNTGDCNTGNSNTGDRNTGNRNTGDRNTGYRNTGNSNTGHWNTGHCNTGHCNTGHWNTGNSNTGYCNTNEPNVRIFNKETNKKHGEIIFPDFFYFNLTEWIYESYMTDEEKDSYPSYVTTGGYLKCYDYKQAFKKSYEKASKEDREKVKELPNFCPEIFYSISGIKIEEISGIRVDEEIKKTITIEGKEIKISEESFKELKKQLLD